MTGKAEMKSKHLLVLHTGVLIYSVSAVFIKLAAGTGLFSLRFFLFCCLSLLSLMLYALIWQRVLNFLALSTAYINRSAVFLWNTLFSFFVFAEKITIKQIAGVIVIIVGVMLVVSDDG